MKFLDDKIIDNKIALEKISKDLNALIRENIDIKDEFSIKYLMLSKQCVDISIELLQFSFDSLKRKEE